MNGGAEGKNLFQQREIGKMKAAGKLDAWLSPMFGQSAQSVSGFQLEVDFEDYLELVDWTGRQIRNGKPGSIPHQLSAILQRLELRQDNWVGSVERYGSMFYRICGTVRALLDASQRTGRCWFQGHEAAREVFCEA